MNSMKNRFKKNQLLLKSIASFAPSQFSELQRKFKTSNELQSEILSFCQTYGIDSFVLMSYSAFLDPSKSLIAQFLPMNL